MIDTERTCKPDAGLNLPLTAAQLGKWYVYIFELLLDITNLCATVIEVPTPSAWGEVSYLR